MTGWWMFWHAVRGHALVSFGHEGADSRFRCWRCLHDGKVYHGLKEPHWCFADNV